MVEAVNAVNVVNALKALRANMPRVAPTVNNPVRAQMTETEPGAQRTEWIKGEEARDLLEWESVDSVRDAAKYRGAFRWRKKGRRIVYDRAGVLAYRAKQQGAEVLAEQPA